MTEMYRLPCPGGRVVSTNGTPNYEAEDSTLSFLGISLYEYRRSNPAAILQVSAWARGPGPGRPSR